MMYRIRKGNGKGKEDEIVKDEPLEVDSRLHNTLVTRIEEAVKPANIKIIQNPRESIKLAYDIVKSAKNEVLKIFPSIKGISPTNAYRYNASI
ncbi:MAG: hypothetical protein WB975_10095 [Nitrososphaeraceae archaeon]